MVFLRLGPELNRRLAALVPTCSMLLLSTLAVAQDDSIRKSSLRFEYQYIRTGEFFDESLVYGTGGDIGTTDTHALILSGNLPIGDSLSLFASVPYIQKRHQGNNPHNFLEFSNFNPPDRRIVDDGDYHGGLQDLSFGARYRFLEGPVQISPFISYGVPMNDYPIYGKAAIGANLWAIPIGVQLDFQPYFSDWSFSGNVAYVFREEPLDINVDYWLYTVSAGYYFSPRTFVSAFVFGKDTPQGVELPWDFTDDPTYGDLADFDTELWWQHDRVLAHSFTNIGLGVDYIINERYQFSGQAWTSLTADQVNEVDYAFSLALTVFFGSN